MTKSDAFEEASQEVVLSLRLGQGLDSQHIQKMAAVLTELLPIWQSASHISKADVFALIVLRDNIIGAKQHYKDSEILGRVNAIAQLVESFMEQALLSSGE